ncbi:hypothetical protein [Candidatus Nitrososphaera gargensis]|nr:hypothetical protein [Candidatus Nitrososphaera gargensis]
MTAVKSIKVTEETYRKLVRLGTLEDSFDSVISKLISNAEGRDADE